MMGDQRRTRGRFFQFSDQGGEEMKTRGAVGVLVVAMTALVGCASTPKSSHKVLSPTIRASISDAPIEVRLEETAAFRHHTSAQQGGIMVGVLFGAIGGGVAAIAADARARSLGEKLVRETELVDPTPELARRLMSVLEQKLGAVEGNSPIQLTVSTEGWGIGKPGVYCHTRVALVDTRTDTRIAQALCRYVTPKEENPGDVGVVLADNAAFVKSSLDKAVDACVDYFAHNVVP